MAKRIDIAGVIVSSDFDDDYFSAWIDKGLITPESRVTKALDEAAANDNEDVEICINSYGGNVFAGNEMLARIQDYKGYISVTVGALAASQAANIVLQSGRRTECHENSILLFHSASTIAEGGAGALKDEAKMLEQINAPMMERLVALGVPEDVVKEGFAEGRQFTLGAQEALKYGIVQKILPGAGKLPAKPKAAADDVLATQLAALANYGDPDAVAEVAEAAEVVNSDNTAETANDDAPVEETAKAEETAPAETQAEPQETQDNACVAPVADDVSAAWGKRLAGLQAAKDKEIHALHTELEKNKTEYTAKLAESNTALTAAQAKISSLEDAVEKYEKALAEKDKQLARMTDIHARTVGRVLASDDDYAGDPKMILASLPVSKRDAYYRAHADEINK